MTTTSVIATTLTSVNTSATEQTPVLTSDRQNSFSNDRDRASLPYLWVTDSAAAKPLAELRMFAGICSPATPNYKLGHHILCLDPDTPELTWKTIAYNLINEGSEVSVCQLGTTNPQPLEWYLGDIPPHETAVHIIMSLVPWQDWQKGLDSKLDTEEARELA